MQTLNVIQALDVIPLRQKQARLQLSLLIDCKVHAKQSVNSNSRTCERYDAPTFVKLLFSFDAGKVLRSLRGGQHETCYASRTNESIKDKSGRNWPRAKVVARELKEERSGSLRRLIS